MEKYNKKTGTINEVFRPETGDVPIPIGLAKAVDHVRDKKIALKRSLESPEERALRESEANERRMEVMEAMGTGQQAGLPSPFQTSVDRNQMKMRTDVNGVTTPAHKQRLLSEEETLI